MKWQCSREIFTPEELEILDGYGDKFKQLMNGERRPKTEAQKRFIEVSYGRCVPETEYEQVWWKYLQRIKLEQDPKHQQAMGERRSMPNDREDWKKMRNAVRSNMSSRSRGLYD